MTRHTVDEWETVYKVRRCECCGHTNQGEDRCPHAINPHYPCPHDPKRAQRQQRLRKLGR